ncbi:hypothetical protein Tco_0436568 [Tanacetum coccineum]
MSGMIPMEQSWVVEIDIRCVDGDWLAFSIVVLGAWIPWSELVRSLLKGSGSALSEAFLSSCGCCTNLVLLLKNFLKSLTSISYSSSLLLGEEVSSSLDSFLAFRATIERGFLSQKGSGVGRGVKEKQVSMADKSVENMNDAGTKLGPTLADNTPGMSSYANVTGVPSRKAWKFRTVFTPTGNGVDVIVPVESIRAISERIFSIQFSSIDGLDAVLENDPWFIRNNPLILKKNECPKNIDLDVLKNMKKPRQATRGFPVGPKVGFKPVKQVYRQVSKKTMPTLVGKPLAKVDSSGDHDSEDEVASVDNEMANFLASKKVGYGTNSLQEKWKETYENDDYDFDPYDDDMYEGHDIPYKIQAICDNLYIKVRGRKKK